ncbi:MAG: hypothetical protein KAI63_05455 [Planctomycetes bacterium]|nr:hypothetical protein [Planctomycetota bacterium]
MIKIIINLIYWTTHQHPLFYILIIALVGLFIYFYKSNILTIANLTYREACRQPLFYIMILVSVGLLLISPYFTLFTFEEDAKLTMIREVGLATITVAGLFIAILSAYFVISAEITKMTTITLLSKPVRKHDFIIGKFLGIVLTVGIGMLFLALVFLIVYWLKEIQPQIEKNIAQQRYTDNYYLLWQNIGDFLHQEVLLIGKGVYLAFLQIVIITAFATVLACHFSLVVTGIGCLLAFIAGHISVFIYQALVGMDLIVLTICGNVSSFLLPNLTNFNVASLVATLTPISFNYLVLTTVYGILYSSIILAIGIIIFNKREMI